MGICDRVLFNVVEIYGEKASVFCAEGFMWKAAWMIIAAISVICVAILLADLAGIGVSSRALGKLDSKSTEMSEKNEQLRAEIAYNAGDISVCTEAVKLNLVSGSGVRTIVLTAPQDANMTISASGQRQE